MINFFNSTQKIILCIGDKKSNPTTNSSLARDLKITYTSVKQRLGEDLLPRDIINNPSLFGRMKPLTLTKKGKELYLHLSQLRLLVKEDYE